ncbi:MAG: esterase-like activity of phytase family protein, partial [Alphaproteobacteria bacterium]|nr:esterase-like activity of phytase family protein [Alphaproteobacteria bacterium]
MSIAKIRCAAHPFAALYPIVLLGLILLLAPERAAAQMADDLRVNVEPVPLGTDDEGNEITQVGQLTYLGGLHLTSNEPDFGGFSGLYVTPDGRELLAVSDRGHWWLGRIYEQDGLLFDVGSHLLTPVLGANQMELSPVQQDLEALAVDGETVFVARERVHEIVRHVFTLPGDLLSVTYSVPRAYPKLAGWRNMPPNGGLEAMVALGHDLLFVLSEESVNLDGTGQGWLLYDGLYQTLSLKRAQNFKPTDMALLPDGDILVLLRRYNPFTGVAVRLCVIDRQMLKPEA